MNEITTETSTETYSGHRLWRSLLYALLFAPVLAGVAIYLFWTGTLSMTNENGLTKVTREVSLKTLEEQFGVRIRLLGVTASGGMIDLRYKVLDKEKAKFLLGEENTISLDIENGMTLTPDTSGIK